MKIDLERMGASQCFEFLTSTVVPRPIALITSVDAEGRPNAAPYSFFGLVAHDPPAVAIGVLPHPEGRLKDTASNIVATQEFVVHLVSEELGDAMNITCIDAPPGYDELALAKLETVAADKVKVPRITGAPVALECRNHTTLRLGPNSLVVIGLIVHAHVGDEFVLDAANRTVDTPQLRLIGGMHGAKWYCRTSDLLQMDRPSWTDWASRGKV